MKMLDRLQEKPAVTVAVLLALIAVCWGYIILRASGTSILGGNRVYFLDLQTADLFDAPANSKSPMTAPSGGEGVRAYVFACGSCADASQRFVAYVEKFSEQAAAELKRPTAERNMEVYEKGHLVAAAPVQGIQPQWLSIDHRGASQVTESPWQRCDDAEECTPE